MFSKIITLCRSASLYCCARFLVPPIRSTCLRSALIETTIVSPSIYITALLLRAHHHSPLLTIP